MDVLQQGFHGRIVNGYGINIAPSSRHSNLLEARKAIDAALAVMGTTT